MYDVADLHATPSGRTLRDDGERREIETLARLEKDLLMRADLTLCVSEPLVERVSPYSRSVRLVPNGADWHRYITATPDLPRSGQVKVGYVGTLAPRFDVELVAAVARARPDWTIELVGPTLPFVDVSSLASLPNVELTGEIPFEAVPAKLATFDVCLLPLREIDFAYYCSPIQVFDYLAAGKPVVSTPIGQLEGWRGLVHIARGADAFVQSIETALGQRTSLHFIERRVFAARNSWDVRVKQSSMRSRRLASCSVTTRHVRGPRRERPADLSREPRRRPHRGVAAALSEARRRLVSSDLPTAAARRTNASSSSLTAIRFRSPTPTLGPFDPFEKRDRLAWGLAKLGAGWIVLVDSDEFLELPYRSLSAHGQRDALARGRLSSGTDASTLRLGRRRSSQRASPFVAYPWCSVDLYADLDNRRR